MDHDWLAAANDAYDAISADPEEVLVAVAGVGASCCLGTLAAISL